MPTNITNNTTPQPTSTRKIDPTYTKHTRSVVTDDNGVATDINIQHDDQGNIQNVS